MAHVVRIGCELSQWRCRVELFHAMLNYFSNFFYFFNILEFAESGWRQVYFTI